MKKVTSIGGVFFKSKNQEESRQWYKKHLGLNVGKYGTSFEWRYPEDKEKKGYTAWNPFEKGSDYFGDAEQQFMINYRVENLTELIENLRSNNVEIAKEIESYEYGKFAHIIDYDGYRIELWEPIDEVYGSMGDEITK